MKVKKNSLIELIAAFYINSFVILKPILIRYSYVSFYILMIEVCFLSIIYIVNSNYKINRRNTIIMLLFVTLASCLFLFDYCIRRNRFLFNYYYYFIIYGIITSFFFINVKDYTKILKYWTIFAIIGGFMYIIDPFTGYRMSGGYMEFGTIMLPAFAAAIISVIYYKVKYVLPLVFVFLFEIIIYANKGAIFSSAVIMVFYFAYLSDSNRTRLRRICSVIVAFTAIICLKHQILKGLIKISDYIGVRSYSLIGLDESINLGATLDSYSARNSIWIKVITELKDNFFYGMGVGGFEEKYGNYAHNFVLDILISYGVIVGVVIFICMAIFIKDTILCKNKEQLMFSVSILLLWLFPMIFSFTYWKVNTFWTFIIISMYRKSMELGNKYENFSKYV